VVVRQQGFLLLSISDENPGDDTSYRQVPNRRCASMRINMFDSEEEKPDIADRFMSETVGDTHS
jgi:hypothetical protein